MKFKQKILLITAIVLGIVAALVVYLTPEKKVKFEITDILGTVHDLELRTEQVKITIFAKSSSTFLSEKDSLDEYLENLSRFNRDTLIMMVLTKDYPITEKTKEFAKKPYCIIMYTTEEITKRFRVSTLPQSFIAVTDKKSGFAKETMYLGYLIPERLENEIIKGYYGALELASKKSIEDQKKSQK